MTCPVFRPSFRGGTDASVLEESDEEGEGGRTNEEAGAKDGGWVGWVMERVNDRSRDTTRGTARTDCHRTTARGVDLRGQLIGIYGIHGVSGIYWKVRHSLGGGQRSSQVQNLVHMGGGLAGVGLVLNAGRPPAGRTEGQLDACRFRCATTEEDREGGR